MLSITTMNYQNSWIWSIVFRYGSHACLSDCILARSSTNHHQTGSIGIVWARSVRINLEVIWLCLVLWTTRMQLPKVWISSVMTIIISLLFILPRNRLYFCRLQKQPAFAKENNPTVLCGLMHQKTYLPWMVSSNFVENRWSIRFFTISPVCINALRRVREIICTYKYLINF